MVERFLGVKARSFAVVYALHFFACGSRCNRTGKRQYALLLSDLILFTGVSPAPTRFRRGALTTSVTTSFFLRSFLFIEGPLRETFEHPIQRAFGQQDVLSTGRQDVLSTGQQNSGRSI
jgi:hypothetical protein